METLSFEEDLKAGKGCLKVINEVGSIDIQPHNQLSIIIDAEIRHMDVTVHKEDNTVYVRAERNEAARGISGMLGRLLDNDQPKAN